MTESPLEDTLSYILLRETVLTHLLHYFIVDFDSQILGLVFEVVDLILSQLKPGMAVYVGGSQSFEGVNFQHLGDEIPDLWGEFGLRGEVEVSNHDDIVQLIEGLRFERHLSSHHRI